MVFCIDTCGYLEIRAISGFSIHFGNRVGVVCL